MQQAGIYLRISSDHTGEGLGVARQGDDCIALAERRGWTIYDTYPDNDRSATKHSVKREHFERLLADIESDKVTIVIAWMLDRLVRSPFDRYRFYELCQRKGVVLALARGGDLDMSTPIGRASAGMLAEVARIEGDFKSDRQKSKNLQSARAGKPHITHRPMGYEDDCVTIRTDEADILQLMAKLVIAGNSYQETAWQLNERGFRNGRGNKFLGLTVHRFITNKRYAGVREYQGVEYPAQWPAIFDTETWQQLQLTVRLRKDAASGRVVGRKFLLTGLLYCGECGQMLTGVTERHSRTKKEYRAYRCFRVGRTERKGGCGKIFRNAEYLEAHLRELVLYRLDSPALARLLQPTGSSDDLARLLTERHAQQQVVDGLVDDYATGLLTRAQLVRAKATAQVELDRIEAEIGRLSNRSALTDLALNETLASAWDSHRDEWRRRLLDLVIERVVVNRGNNQKAIRRADGSYYRFSPELISVKWRDDVQ